MIDFRKAVGEFRALATAYVVAALTILLTITLTIGSGNKASNDVPLPTAQTVASQIHNNAPRPYMAMKAPAVKQPPQKPAPAPPKATEKPAKPAPKPPKKAPEPPKPSEHVKHVQTRLNKHGYAVKVDGFRGTQTTSAIKQFQRDHGLVADGLDTDCTMKALEKAPAPMPAPAPKPKPKAPAPKAPATSTGSTKPAGYLLPANYRTIVNFFMSHGYTKYAACGIAGNIYRESLGNPEAVGTGGGGLIGWTPLKPGMITGNVTRDLNYQLSQILVYNNIWRSYIPMLNSADSPESAAYIYSKYFERPGIPANDMRMDSARAVYNAMFG